MNRAMSHDWHRCIFMSMFEVHIYPALSGIWLVLSTFLEDILTHFCRVTMEPLFYIGSLSMRHLCLRHVDISKRVGL